MFKLVFCPEKVPVRERTALRCSTLYDRSYVYLTFRDCGLVCQRVERLFEICC